MDNIKIGVINLKRDIELSYNMYVNDKEGFIKTAKEFFYGIDLFFNEDYFLIIQSPTYTKLLENDKMLINAFIFNSMKSGIISKKIKEYVFPSNIRKKLNKLVKI